MKGVATVRQSHRVPLDALVVYDRALRLREAPLAFDAQMPRELSFVSHALISGVRRHKRVLLSETTAELLAAMTNKTRNRSNHAQNLMPIQWARQFSLGTLGLELFPSGYVLGGASILVEHKATQLLYAGPIRLGESPLSERMETRHCDILLFDCDMAVGEAADATARVHAFVERAAAEDRTPIFVCPPVGIAQQMLAALSQLSDVPIWVHPQLLCTSRLYAQRCAGFDAKILSRFRRYNPKHVFANGSRDIIVWPTTSRSHGPSHLKRTLRARVCTLASHCETVDPQTDVVLPLETAATESQIVDYIAASRAKTVGMLGNATTQIQTRLHKLGLEVALLGPTKQLRLV